jgi:hypothetical protein
MAFSAGGSEVAVNFYGFRLRPFSSNCANHDGKQRPGGAWLLPAIHDGFALRRASMKPPDGDAPVSGVAAIEPLGGLACTG